MTTFKLIAALALAAAPLGAAETRYIKFATLAPEGSTWMNEMNALSAELSERTQGQLKFKMYPGGVSGDEKDVVKKVRIGQLQAAGFTGVGLGEIAPEARVFDSPWLFKDRKEVDFVHKRFDAELTKSIEKAGYVLLGWTDLGSVYVFSKAPIRGPADMKKAKMWVWEGDPIAQAAYKAIGVSPIPLSVVDVMSSLHSGMIDAVYGPPLGVVALQWHARTKHIYSVPMAESLGAVLLSKRFFDALPEDQRRILLEVSAKHLKKLNEATRAENESALQALQKQGLTLTGSLDAETSKLYSDLGRKARRDLAGKLYSASLLDRIEASLEDYRRTAGGKAQKS